MNISQSNNIPLRRHKSNLLNRRIPKPSYRHAAPAGSDFVLTQTGWAHADHCTRRPWPYIDSLADQESEDVIDAKTSAIIGSCGHDDCDDCKKWIAYPQSLFGNWTIKPVTKCGIERAVRNREHSSVIYRCDVLENGVFGESGTSRVSAQNKREYWRDTLLPDVSFTLRIVIIDLSHNWIKAGGRDSCSRIVRWANVRSCSANAWN